ncbi:hypothetical protein EJ07DRAFT_150040 [Lizonia empirigonia]|nr:hypothetical protein EJ07DRAFT_150040 [Lizonia empirigonia]
MGKRDSRQSPQTLGNDPSAGSPTETLLRLLLPLNDRASLSHSIVVATGGVYKGQGRNQRMLMTCAY